MAIIWNEETRTFHLQGAHSSYILHVDGDGTLLNLYWGERLPEGDYTGLLGSYWAGASFDSREGRLPYEVPTRGTGYYGEGALCVRNGAGNDTVALTYAGHETYPGKRPLPGLPATYAESDGEAETLVVRLEDRLTGLQVELSYTLFTGTDAIARSMRLVNGSAADLEITDLPVVSVPFFGMDFDAIHLHGAWARERHVERVPLSHGGVRVGSTRGASGHAENPFICLCRPGADEFQGQVWAASFVYSGSFLAQAEAGNFDNARLSMGMHSAVFRWLLAPDEVFQSPEAVLVYSHDGLNGMSQTYHRLYRTRLARGHWRDRERPVLINNWEATYFRFTSEKILEIARRAAEIGVELFVLDDGWFGKRDQDNCSLGDWVVNEEKLPGGLKPLAEEINRMGMLFGLWFEPEMISPDSDLYLAHPDWCLHIVGRRRTEQRQQLILDMSRPEVQDYVAEAVCRVLGSAPIGYVKWDMNRNMSEYCSAACPPERQMEVQHRYMLGVYSVMERVTSAFPQVLFESCSGGGGRFDPGMLYYMPQTWTSDDTDAVERLKIQYGTSFVYPVSAMGAHVSAVPNHQTDRVTDMTMRCDAAMSGNFGFELDLSRLSPEELAVAKDYVARVKALRGLLQKGAFTRLLSPFEGNWASWQFLSEDGNRAALFLFRRLAEPNPAARRLTMRGLEPDALYADDASGRVYSGAELMYVGVVPTSMPLRGDARSAVLTFTRV